MDKNALESLSSISNKILTIQWSIVSFMFVTGGLSLWYILKKKTDKFKRHSIYMFPMPLIFGGCALILARIVPVVLSKWKNKDCCLNNDEKKIYQQNVYLLTILSILTIALAFILHIAEGKIIDNVVREKKDFRSYLGVLLMHVVGIGICVILLQALGAAHIKNKADELCGRKLTDKEIEKVIEENCKKEI